MTSGGPDSDDGSPLGMPTAWPPGRPRILVADAWLANAGDGAIAIATERRLRKLVPAAAVLHAAYQGDLVGSHYPELQLVPPLAALVGAVRPSRIPECSGWDESELSAIVNHADVVLSQGGGFLIEHYRPSQRLVAYERVIDRGLPLAFTAQTIGRFDEEPGRAALARALGDAVAVSVRDRRSARNVAELGLGPDRVRLAADEAFGLFPDPPEPAAGRGVALVLSRHTLVGSDRWVHQEPALERAIVDTVRAVAEAADPEPLTVLSTTQGLGALGRGLEDDSEFADEVLRALPPDLTESVRRIDGYMPPHRFADLLSRHRAIVSMRMHPVIFALSKGVPTVALTSADKALDLLSDLGMEGVAVPWLDPEATAEALRRALEPDATRDAGLWARLEGARRRAEVSGEVMADLLAAAEARA